ncbi:MAG: hypothetical protein JWM05_3377 [Acidimicrobiales bacterium]|nr:hypothetical protein [Acidimicrobiales bacterium]
MTVRRTLRTLLMMATVATLLLVGWLGAAPAGAVGGAAQHDEPTTVPPSSLGAYQTEGGLPVFGADIACPAKPGRRLDNIHASAFLESFLADARFGNDN